MYLSQSIYHPQISRNYPVLVNIPPSLQHTKYHDKTIKSIHACPPQHPPHRDKCNPNSPISDQPLPVQHILNAVPRLQLACAAPPLIHCNTIQHHPPPYPYPDLVKWDLESLYSPFMHEGMRTKRSFTKASPCHWKYAAELLVVGSLRRRCYYLDYSTKFFCYAWLGAVLALVGFCC